MHDCTLKNFQILQILCKKAMERRRKRYLSNATLPIPRRTMYRIRHSALQDTDSDSSDSDDDGSSSGSMTELLS